jgi:glycosyltransferase involved in cell wall biosynthesis
MRVFVISKGMPTEQYPLNGIFEFDQAKALARSGAEVAMLVIDFRSGSYKRKYGFSEYETEGVRVFELSLPLGLYRRALPLLRYLLIKVYKKAVKACGQPDIIHAQFYSIGAIAAVLKKRYKVPFVITEHSSKLNTDLQNISQLDLNLAKSAYQCADKLIAVSHALAANLKNNFQVEATVIPNIVDVSQFQYVERTPKDDFTFISVGNLVKIKGFDQLLEAFAEAFKADNAVKLSIVGDGPELENLQNTVTCLNLNGKVSLLRTIGRNRIKSFYQEGDAFVLASHSETFGVVFIEAMATGLPVIATSCGGPNDIVTENAGYLIPVDDRQALVSALQSMRNNAYNFNSLEISRNCIEKYSPETVGRQIIEAYASVSDSIR